MQLFLPQQLVQLFKPISPAILLTALLFKVGTLAAQPVIASQPDNIIAGLSVSTLSDDAGVNCDMLQDGRNGNVMAIVDGCRGNVSDLWVRDYTGSTFGYTLGFSTPFDYDPDVAMGNLIGPTGTVDWYVATVTMEAGDVILNVFQMNNVGVGGLSLTNIYSNRITLTLGGADGHPHIDILPDPTSTINGAPSMHTIAVTWTESGVPYIYTDEINVPGGSFANWIAPSGFPGGTCYKPDIAASYDIATGSQTLYLASGTSLGLDLAKYDIGSSTTTHTLIHAGVSPYIQRIEAMGVHNSGLTTPPAEWEIVASINLGFGAGWQEYGYNDLITAPTHISAPFSGSDIQAPAVAAGIDFGYSGDIGNRQYTVGFFPWAGTDIWSRSIDAVSGVMTSALYYQVNMGPVNYPWDAAQNYAVSNCSNTGKDILSAWFDGTSVLYKTSPNAMIFKMAPAQVMNVNPVHIYPNPAVNLLHLDGAVGQSYTVCDLTGKVVLTGAVNQQSEVISIGQLSSGMYTINMIEHGRQNRAIKFMKQ